MTTRFTGSMVALVTPFTETNEIDWDALARLVNMQLEAGTHALIVGGTTGEAATMTLEERAKVVSFVIERVKGAIPIVVGTGAMSTRVAIELSAHAKEVGADGLLVVTPPYNKPTQEGLIDYYTSIAQQVKHPIILYNVPGRTSCDLAPRTAGKLAENSYIVAIKDATADMQVGAEIIERCGDRLTLLSGDDFTALPLLSIGGEGWISVTANIVPKDMVDMYNAWQAGEITKARELHFKMLPLHRAMFLQSNPIPVKQALFEMKVAHAYVRSPLVRMPAGLINKVKTIVSDYGLV